MTVADALEALKRVRVLSERRADDEDFDMISAALALGELGAVVSE